MPVSHKKQNDQHRKEQDGKKQNPSKDRKHLINPFLSRSQGRFLFRHHSTREERMQETPLSHVQNPHLQPVWFLLTI